MKNKLLSVITAAAVLSLTLSTIAVILCTKAYIGAASGRSEPMSGPIDGITADMTFEHTDVSDGAYDTNDASTNGNFGAANAFSFGNDNSILLFYDAESGRLIAADPFGNEVYSAPFEIDILTGDEADRLCCGIILDDAAALASAIEDLTS